MRQFARCVGGDGQGELFWSDSATVIGDADQFDSATFDRDLDRARTGIDAVFQQFLDDARRSFDDFACSDFVDQPDGELAYRWHGVFSLWRASFRCLRLFHRVPKRLQTGNLRWFQEPVNLLFGSVATRTILRAGLGLLSPPPFPPRVSPKPPGIHA